jgi:hypothetical protein
LAAERRKKTLEEKIKKLEWRVAVLTATSMMTVAVILYILDREDLSAKILSTVLIIVALAYLLWESMKKEGDAEETPLYWFCLRLLERKRYTVFASKP